MHVQRVAWVHVAVMLPQGNLYITSLVHMTMNPSWLGLFFFLQMQEREELAGEETVHREGRGQLQVQQME